MVGGAGGLAALGKSLRRCPGEAGLPADPHRRRPRHRQRAADAQTRRCAQSLARPAGRGRHRPGHFGDRRHPLHAFRGAGLRACHPKGPRQGGVPRGGHPGPGWNGDVAVRGGEKPRAAATLRHQAVGGGLERRRLHRQGGSRASAPGALPGRLAVRGKGAVRAVHPRQGAHLRGDGGGGPRRHRNPADRALLRLRGEIRPRRLPAPASGAAFTKCLPRGPKTGASGASRTRVPGREPCGFPLRRFRGGDEGTVLSRSQHSARHDRDLADALTRPGNMRGRRGAGARLRPGQPVLAPVLAKMASRISRFMRFWALRLEGVRIPRFTGIAASALFLVASIGYGAVRGDHVRMIVDTLEDWRDAGANSLGFRIAAVSLSGEKHVSRAEIVAAAGVTGRTSLLFLDVEAARARLKTMPWIAEATVRKLFPDRLQIRVREREPFALWQVGGRLSLIARYPSIREQVRASVLVAERRWNLKLKNNVDIRLPETDAGPALDTLLALDRDKRLISRDILAIDLRLPDRVTVRLSDAAAQAREEARKPPKKKGGDA